MNLANACANVPHLQTSSSRATEFERQIFNWRIRRLVNSGLLRKQVISYLAAEALYSITRGGIQALEELGVTHLGGYVEREKDPHAAQISRVLELNRIRLALERSGTWRFGCLKHSSASSIYLRRSVMQRFMTPWRRSILATRFGRSSQLKTSAR
jgi:hypothetical protein